MVEPPRLDSPTSDASRRGMLVGVRAESSLMIHHSPPAGENVGDHGLTDIEAVVDWPVEERVAYARGVARNVAMRSISRMDLLAARSPSPRYTQWVEQVEGALMMTFEANPPPI